MYYCFAQDRIYFYDYNYTIKYYLINLGTSTNRKVIIRFKSGKFFHI